jgi:diaminohydroxyphosphoribosylaminopyrimidine deaminase / 5-amino-6-(5-phosphoribosylamino)uracil reductase
LPGVNSDSLTSLRDTLSIVAKLPNLQAMNGELYMRRAMLLAQKGLGATAPNPLVGAVLVHNGVVIGEGWHHKWGGSHAEVVCLESVPAPLRHLIPDSTMYVTLEPCSHHGKTPPCAQRLIDEGIRQVVVAHTDPFSKVSGKGIALLKQAGVHTEIGQCQAESHWQNRRFFCANTKQRPYIILKFAKTADGYIAPNEGGRASITGSMANMLVHQWRTQEQAILIGAKTAIQDQPQLTSRLWQGRDPMRVVVGDSAAANPPKSLLSSDAPTWLLNTTREEQLGNVHYKKVPLHTDMLPSAFALLHQQQVQSVLVEGGAQILQHLFALGLWDEARVFTAPSTLGKGLWAPTVVGGTRVMSEKIGDDLLELYVREESDFPYVVGMPI